MSRRSAKWSLLASCLVFLLAFSAKAQDAETPDTAAAESEPAGSEPADVDEQAEQADVDEQAEQADVDEQAEQADVDEQAEQADVDEQAEPADVEEQAEPAEPTGATNEGQGDDLSWLEDAPSDDGTDAAAPAAEEDGTNCRGRCFFENLSETDHPFSIRRGRSSLGFIGSIQLLAIPFIQNPMASIESNSIADAEGFRLRRARFGFGGSLPHDFDFRMLFELGDGGANILDASVAWEPHELARITAGALKVPFSGIMMLSSEYQSFLQRPYAVRTIAPDRALGVEVSGSNFFFSYNAGVFNGGGDYYRGDNNAGMLYAARVAAHILGPPPAGEITQPDGLIFQIAGSYFFNQDATGNRNAVSAELLLRWRRLSFRGEFVWDTFDPAGDPDSGESIEYGSTERRGWFTEAGVFIINDHLQVALRYEAQQIIEASFDFPDMLDLWAISGAVNGYFLQGRIKLSLQYEHRREWNDPQLDNDYFALQLQGRI